MKQTIVKYTAILFLATLSSCGIDMFNRIEGNNKVISINRDINQDFTKVRVSTGIELIIDQGSEVSLTVEADENLHDIIITEVEDGKLKIYTEKNIWKSASKKVYLTVNTLEELKASSGSNIKTSNVLKVTNLNVGSSSGASVNLDINATNVISDSSSGSTMKIKGEASTHETEASSGSSINAYRLVSKNVTAKVSSGASISVYASENINGRASSGGSISFEGDPKIVTKNTSSGGSISSRK